MKENEPLVEHVMRRREGYSNTLQFVGIAITTGGLIDLSRSPLTLYIGIAFSVVGIILSTGFRSMADVSRQSQKYEPHDNNKKFEKYLAPRKSAMLGALVATAGSLALLATQCAHHGTMHLGNYSYTMLGAIGLGLTLMASSAFLALRRDKANASPNEGEGELFLSNMRTSFFGRNLIMTGAIGAGAGVTLMRTGLWSPGVNTLLVGIGVMLSGAILDSFIATAYEFTTAGKIHGQDWDRVQIPNEVGTPRVIIAPLGAITATGAGIDIAHELLSSPHHSLSLSSANMIAFMVGVTVTLASMAYSTWHKIDFDKTYDNIDYRALRPSCGTSDESFA